MKKIVLFMSVFMASFCYFDAAKSAEECALDFVTGKHVCSPQNSGGGDARAACEGKEEGETCNSNGASNATCEYRVMKTGESPVLTCVAFECKNSYLLQTTYCVGNRGYKDGKCVGGRRRSIVVEESTVPAKDGSQKPPMEEVNGEKEQLKVGSHGICRKPVCTNCGCDQNQTCVLNKVVVKNKMRDKTTTKIMDAYINEAACVCVDNNGGNGDNGGNENTPVVDPGDSCVYHFDGDVICLDGRVVKYGGYDLVLTDEQKQGFTCEKFNEQFKNDLDKLLKLAPELCEQGQGGSSQGLSQGGGNGGGSANVSLENAKTTVSKFFADAKGNLSVWKTAEGKFNTARLASDLTAGVVLGTVGGVVSGVVIKKKQVEKGFDALHCAVGGQTIADWGDTFTVGLR